MSLIIKSINLSVVEVTSGPQRGEFVVLPTSTSSSGGSALVDINGLDPGSDITIRFIDPMNGKGEASVSFTYHSPTASMWKDWEEVRQDSANGQYRVHSRLVSLPMLFGLQMSYESIFVITYACFDSGRR